MKRHAKRLVKTTQRVRPSRTRHGLMGGAGFGVPRVSQRGALVYPFDLNDLKDLKDLKVLLALTLQPNHSALLKPFHHVVQFTLSVNIVYIGQMLLLLPTSPLSATARTETHKHRDNHNHKA